MARPLDVFISYSQDSREHAQRVLELSDRLRRDGIDCHIDQYEVSPPEGWPKWMDRRIAEADFVLVVCTETYLRRVMGEERAGVGLGVRWESLLLYQYLYDAGSNNTKFVPVIFRACDAAHIAKPLAGATRVCLEHADGYAHLLRRLHGIPPAERPPLGPPLPERQMQPSFFRTPENNFLEAGVIRNLDFVGRQALLAELHARLGSGNVALVHALAGEGGVGKTQLAIEYAYRHAGDYDGIWWVDASDVAVDAATARLAQCLGIRLRLDAKPEDIRLAVRGHLSAGRHLLILDNLGTPGGLREFVPQPPGRVLVTTRRKDLPTGLAQKMDVDVLTEPEALELLRKHRPDLTGRQHDAALASVVEHLGRHSLAVALAGAYLAGRPNVAPATLLARLKKAEIGEKDDLFEGMDPAEDIGAGYKLKVAQCLSLHFVQLEGTLAEEVLELAAFCHPDAIPVELFCRVLAGKRVSQEQVETALKDLAALSIVKYSATIAIHRLMQSAVRARMRKDKRRRTVERILAVLQEVFEDALDPANMPAQDAYAAHAEAVVEHAEGVGGLADAGVVANRLGLYLGNRARYDAALATLKIAERIHRGAHGDNHPEVATDVNNIGGVLQDKGDLDGAMECYREAERIDRVAYGGNHPKIAIRVNNIGGVLQEKGDLDGAMKCFREAERIDRAAYGDNHPTVAAHVNNIGGVLQDKGDLDGALECYREAERIDRAAYGDNHPKVAIRVNNIGGVLRAKGDLDEALKCYREAERIGRAVYGDNHPEVATDVNNIGIVLQDQGHLDEARAALVNAFEIFLACLGPRALATLQGARNLLAVGVDPIALASQKAGQRAADELALALRNDPPQAE